MSIQPPDDSNNGYQLLKQAGTLVGVGVAYTIAAFKTFTPRGEMKAMREDMKAHFDQDDRRMEHFNATTTEIKQSVSNIEGYLKAISEKKS